MSEPLRQPVRCYLPVEHRSRKGAKVEWWTVEIDRYATFAPVVVQSVLTARGITHRRDFDLYPAQVDTTAGIVICKPYSAAASKLWPLERALQGCGWERCAAPGEVP